MGELEDRLKTVDSGKEPPSPAVKSDIEKALAEADTQDARDILRAQTRRRVAEEEARAREAEARLRQQGGAAMTEQERAEAEKQKAEEELKEKTQRIEQAKALYSSCIEAGGDPKQCAEMVAGLIPTPATTISAPQPASVTELVQALKALDELRGSDKGVAELKASFDRLAEDIRRGNSDRQPMDPMAFAKQQAEQTKAYYDALKSSGMIRESESPSYQGEPLEVVKERHRHDEKMEGLKTEREYKEKLGETVASLPEEVGRGMASRFTEGGEGGSSSGGGLGFVECEDCHTKIFITPNTGNQVKCPKCGAIYTRGGEAEVKTE